MLLYIVAALVKLVVFHSCTINVFFSICANKEVYLTYSFSLITRIALSMNSFMVNIDNSPVPMFSKIYGVCGIAF